MRFSFSKKALPWVKVGYVDPQLAQKRELLVLSRISKTWNQNKHGTRHCLILKIFKNPEPDIITKSKNYPILKLNTNLSSLITSELQPLTSTFFLIIKIFSKIRPEKCDFDQYKGIFMGKMVPICRISKRKKFKSPDFYRKFQ
jgi:hypothetical protein